MRARRITNRHFPGYIKKKGERATRGNVKVNRFNSIPRVLHQLKWRSTWPSKQFRHEMSMDVGSRDGVSKTVSSLDFAHIVHKGVVAHEGTHVDADIALTR